MYFAFNNDFLNQWNHPDDVEKKRKQEEEKKQRELMKMNMESLENCIKKNSIENLDRTKPYDKTFMCGHFISKSRDKYMQADEIQEFAQNVKPIIKELGINYIDTPLIEINETKYTRIYKIWSNFIPKDTFTNIGEKLIFRISNDITEDNVTKNMIEITEAIPNPDEGEKN